MRNRLLITVLVLVTGAAVALAVRARLLPERGPRAAPPSSAERVLDIMESCTEDALPCSSTATPDDAGRWRPRRAIVAVVPSRLATGPFRVPGQPCTLRLGILAGSTSRQRVVLVSGGQRRLLFKSSPTAEAASVWEDHVLPLPVEPDRPFELHFEADRAASSPAAAQVACSSPHIVCSTPPPARAVRPNVVLVSIDTLRADHLGVYGRHPSLTPHLDALAASAWVFEHAYTTAPWTLPAHASMFTGSYPDEHRAVSSLDESPLRFRLCGKTLAERLRAYGYATVGISAGGFVSAQFGLDRGFDVWRVSPETSLDSTVPLAEHHLSAPRPKPTFLFLHTYDVHGPYPDPEGADVPHGQRADPAWEAVVSLGFHGYLKLGRFRGPAQVADAYARAVRRVDDSLGGFLEWMRRTGLMERTLLIVTSDHGESLADHDPYYGHELTLSEALVRVPLIVSAPGGGSRRVCKLTSLVDIPALVLGTLGLPIPASSGRDPLLDPEPDSRRSVRGMATASGAQYAIRYPWKVVTAADPARLTAPVWSRGIRSDRQVYDLAHDPSERDNLAPSHEVEAVRGLTEWLRRSKVPEDFSGFEDVTPELVRQLEALGYLYPPPGPETAKGER
jgi:hypothetical protein